MTDSSLSQIRKSRNGVPSVTYVGQLWKGSTALHRWWAVQELTPGAAHRPIDNTSWFYTRLFRNKLWRWPASAAVKIGQRVDLRRVGSRLIAAAGDSRCRLLWLDKTIDLSPSVLHTVRARNPQLRIVFYTPDDMANPGNKTPRFLASLPLFDCVVTTKSFQIDELKSWGAREVIFVDNAFDPATHRPLELSKADQDFFGCDIGFSGAYEADRANLIRRLGEAGQAVKVFSNQFPPSFGDLPNITVIRRFVPSEEYAKAICGAKISLGFLRKANRDLQTQRSAEIPACGGFLLAERTDEHRRLFEEGKEAEFFEGFDELLAKTRRYLAHESERSAIAAAGRRRCLTAGYSNAGRLAPVVARFF